MKAMLRWASGDRQEIEMRAEDIVQPGGYPASTIRYNGAEFWILSYIPQQRSRPWPVYSEVPRTTSPQPK